MPRSTEPGDSPQGRTTSGRSNNESERSQKLDGAGAASVPPPASSAPPPPPPPSGATSKD
jgi:hypothetical protein